MGASSLRSRWLRIALIASVAIMALAAPAAATDHLVEGEKAVVSGTGGDGLNIRTAPSTGSDVHFVAPEGAVMDVTSGPEQAEGFTWYGVSVDGHDAWVMSQYISGSASQAGDQIKVVNTDGHGLRLRADASLDSETLTVLPEGSMLDVVGDEQSDSSGIAWANIDYNGSTGYAHRGYLAVVANGGQETAGETEEPDHTATDDQQSNEDEAVPAEPEPEPEPEPQQADTNGVAVGGNAEIFNTGGDGLNIRHGAGYGNSVATVAVEGAVVAVLDGPVVDDQGTNWWNVDYRGQGGWAHGGYLRGTDAEPTGVGSSSSQSNDGGDSAPAPSGSSSQIVNEAMQFLGYPYVWGGTTPSGFDCSGFLYYVVNQVTGGGFPRVMEAQVNRGTYVPSDQLQPGDLVFQQNTYQWGLSHAGIYIGNGQFIHAATPGSGVVISNLWDSYWGQRYYTARRIS